MSTQNCQIWTTNYQHEIVQRKKEIGATWGRCCITGMLNDHGVIRNIAFMQDGAHS